MYPITSAALFAALAVTTTAAPTSKRDAAALPNFTAPYGYGTFQLMTIDSGTPQYDGQWVTGLHIGAGENIAFVNPAQNSSSGYFFNATTGDVYFLTSSSNGNTPYVFSFDLGQLYMAGTPAGYNAVQISIPQATAGQGISFEQVGNTMVLPDGVAALSVCEDTGYYAGQAQLLWRNATTVKSEDSGCTDVKLKAIFNHGTSLG